MAFPNPSYHRSDFQHSFHEGWSFADTVAVTDQQADQEQPQMRSGARTRRSDQWGTQWTDDWSEDDEIQVAKTKIRAIIDRVSEVHSDTEIHIDRLIELFTEIKQAQKQGYIECLQKDAPGMLLPLGKRLCHLLNRLSADIASEKFALSVLNGDDLHILFNGLSVIAGETSRQSLIFRADSNQHQARGSLAKITEALLVHSRERAMAEKCWDSSKLINVLNCLSRCLKQGILSRDNAIAREFFISALKLMKQWAPVAGERTSGATLTAPLDTRQLGKCMVQIATAMKFAFVDPVEHRELLRELVLGLCGGSTLDKCVAWKPADDSGQAFRLVLVAVRPEGAEVTNISNTIKDCLVVGVLQLEEEKVQSIIDKICVQIEKIPQHHLLARNGHRLSNCNNFLRQVFEMEQANPERCLKVRAIYDRTCARLLNLIPQQMSQLLLAYPTEQTLANMISFVKAMDRSQRHSAASLKEAASSLVAVLPHVMSAISSVESISATLGGLQHFAQRGLVSRQTAHSLMRSLLDQLDLKALSAWPAKSRAVLVRAAVYCWQEHSVAHSAGLPFNRVKDVMQILLDLPEKNDDHLPYLSAISLLAQIDMNCLSRYQQLLKTLLQANTEKTITLDDIQLALKRLQAREMVIEMLQEPKAALPGRATEPATEPATQPAIRQDAAQQDASTAAVTPLKPNRIVGMTRLLEPQPRQQTYATTVAKVGTVTTASGSARKVSTKASYNRKSLSASQQSPSQARTKTSTTTVSTTASAKKSTAAISLPAAQSAQSQTPEQLKTPAKAPAKAPQNVLSSTEPRLVTRQNTESSSASSLVTSQVSLSKAGGLAEQSQHKGLQNNQKIKNSATIASSPVKKIATPVQPTQNTKAKQSKTAADISGQKTKALLPEEEWFDLLRQEAPLSPVQNQRLVALFQEHPRLAAAKTGKGKQARSALFYALSTGKPYAVLMIMHAEDKEPMAETLKTVFDETLMVGDAEEAALRAYLSSKSPADFAEFRKTIDKKYSAGEMQKKVAKRFLDLLKEFGLLPDTETAEKPAKNVKANDKVSHKANDKANYRSNDKAHDKQDDQERELLRSIEQQKLMVQNKWNELIVAVIEGRVSAVEKILKTKSAKEQTSAVCANGMNALMYAAWRGQFEMVHLLLAQDSGDDMARISDHFRRNALSFAVKAGNENVVSALLSLPSAKQQAKNVNEKGWNALMIAASKGKGSLISLLLELESANEQASVINLAGKNALMVAAHSGHANAAKLLLNLKSAEHQTKVADDQGFNALILATMGGHTDVVRELMKAKSADDQAMAVDREGRNALMIAVARGQVEVVDMLLKLPSAAKQATAVNTLGMNALMLAQVTGNWGIASRLTGVSQ